MSAAATIETYAVLEEEIRALRRENRELRDRLSERDRCIGGLENSRKDAIEALRREDNDRAFVLLHIHVETGLQKREVAVEKGELPR